jgi:hypothetical protein
VLNDGTLLESYNISKVKNNIDTNKTQCVNQEGKVRHDESIIGMNIYCMKSNGDETIFVYSGADSSFTVTLADRLFFGYFSLQSLFESLENESK